MKNKFILILSLFTLTFNAQELDSSFLDSLPDDIKKDLIEKNAKQGLNAKENYKPYLYSSKLNQAEEFIDLKERLELDLLELERRLELDDGLIIDDGLKLFGNDFLIHFRLLSCQQMNQILIQIIT